MRQKTILKIQKAMKKLGTTLKSKDMYDKDGKSILLKETPKKYMARSKYQPHQGAKELAKRTKSV